MGVFVHDHARWIRYIDGKPRMRVAIRQACRMNNDIIISALLMPEDERLHGLGSVCGMISVMWYLSR
jgi:hypothetical protein